VLIPANKIEKLTKKANYKAPDGPLVLSSDASSMLLAGAPIRNLSATSPMRRTSSTDLCDPLLPERPCLMTNEGVNIKPKKQTQKIKLQNTC
jgi:hypothetical protein